MRKYIFDGISLPFSSDPSDALRVVEKKLRGIGIACNECRLAICKKSVDARHKDDIKLIYSVLISFAHLTQKERDRIAKLGARAVTTEELEIKVGNETMQARPLVVGMGPAGMFCALILAENGYKPIIIDRGDSVNDRVAALERFYSEHILDTESNIQFGAGARVLFRTESCLRGSTIPNAPTCSKLS